ncbi:tRNA (adenine-N(6)-)-methyltransferase, partial [Tamlana crocina]|nr:tRNA (adenine-N(6)-)-methyltransferase [Tamlana crocina]
LLEGVSLLLSKRGKFSVIIPYAEEEKFVALASGFKLFPKRITRVKGTPESAVKRTLLELSFLEGEPLEDELIIETARHQYTPKYTELVKDFYLKM